MSSTISSPMSRPMQSAMFSPIDARQPGGSAGSGSDTFRLLDELGDFLTDESGNRLTAPE